MLYSSGFEATQNHLSIHKQELAESWKHQAVHSCITMQKIKFTDLSARPNQTGTLL